jgi:hypothetical protein
LARTCPPEAHRLMADVDAMRITSGEATQFSAAS